MDILEVGPEARAERKSAAPGVLRVRPRTGGVALCGKRPRSPDSPIETIKSCGPIFDHVGTLRQVRQPADIRCHRGAVVYHVRAGFTRLDDACAKEEEEEERQYARLNPHVCGTTTKQAAGSRKSNFQMFGSSGTYDRVLRGVGEGHDARELHIVLCTVLRMMIPPTCAQIQEHTSTHRH